MYAKEIVMLPDGRMTVESASLYLGLAQKTLAMWRCQGKGPPFIKRGRIYYRKADLDQWIIEGAGCKSTAQARLKNM